MSGGWMNVKPWEICPVRGADGGTGHIHDNSGRRCLKCGQRLPSVRTGSGPVEDRSTLHVRPGRLVGMTRTGSSQVSYDEDPGVEDPAGWPDGESPWG
jgi:hypothetical protein